MDENDMEGKTWLVLANTSSAKILAAYKSRVFKDPNDVKNLVPIHEFTHADARKKRSELVSDKQGFYGSGNFAERTDPKFHEGEVFALEIVTYLENSRVENKFKDLNIFAPAHFMGLLNKHMSHALHKLVTQSIEKDYTQQNGRALIQSLMTHW